MELNQELKKVLGEIAFLKRCTVEEAAVIVLERNAERTRDQIKKAHQLADEIADQARKRW